jgi:predicted N-acetyltransferase YhbS
MITITDEGRPHAAAIEALLDRGFGADRRRKRSYSFRRGVPRADGLCLVALVDGKLAGSIRYWPIVIGEERHVALLLGPLAVDPDYRNLGIGTRLMQESLIRAAALDHRVVLLVGDPGFYERFGFTPAIARGIAMPGESPQRLMCRALVRNGLDGVSGDVQPWRSLRGRRLTEAA